MAKITVEYQSMDDDGRFVPKTAQMETVDGPHCQSCGQAVNWNQMVDSYTPCCNERMVDQCTATDCYHF